MSFIRLQALAVSSLCIHSDAAAQFAAVLNEKKTKLRELKEQTEELQRRLREGDNSVRLMLLACPVPDSRHQPSTLLAQLMANFRDDKHFMFLASYLRN
jgi:hypothetical protein